MPEFSRELFSFVEIARERSIRKAADKLNISPSALSRQMRLLESDLGAQLFDRRVKGVELTVKGRLFLKQAEIWLEDGNRLRAELSSEDAEAEKVFRIGAMECFSSSLAPELCSLVRENAGIHRTDVTVGGTSVLIDALRKGMLNMVVAFNVVHSQTIRVIWETPCRIGMVHSPDLCRIDEPEIPVLRCLDWPISLPDKSFSVHTRLYSEILKQRKKAEIMATSNSVNLIRAMVTRGECVSFLSWFDVRDDVLAGRMSFVPLLDKRLVERVCICISGSRPFDRDCAFAVGEARRILERLSVVESPD